MKRFADLLNALVFMPSRNGKLTLMADYFRTAPDPDRGWGLAALAGTVEFRSAKPGMLRGLMESRADPALFRMSYDYVGDLAETCALMWPDAGETLPAPPLAHVVERLAAAKRAEVPGLVAGWLDRLDADARWALLKLITGALRVGVSARLAKTAFARAFDVAVADVEELWHGLEPPYERLFAWAEGRAAKPELGELPVFRPFMLAHPLEDEAIDLKGYLVEWKWDGIRVQLVRQAGQAKLFSRAGDDISNTFPDIVDAIATEAILDGELLVKQPDGAVAPFNHLQQRLNRKTVTAKMLKDYPAFLRLYDVLFEGSEDLRDRPLEARRRRLEQIVTRLPPARFDVSDLIVAGDWDAVQSLREGARTGGLEGLMLKKRDSAYVAGRVKGLWYKWKRDPLSADVVMMYAQRGHGKRSSFYSDFTFGAWAQGQLLPVGKAYFGFTDEELKWLDRWVRNHTVQRYGPVREVEKDLVVELAFDSVHKSPRHKSGLAMRFPRIKRIRTDKPASEADTVEAIAALAEG